MPLFRTSEKYCEDKCTKNRQLRKVISELEELVHVMEIECTPAALDRLRYIITKNGGSLENGKI